MRRVPKEKALTAWPTVGYACGTMRDVTIKVRMTTGERARLASLAAREEVTCSEVVRRLVREEASEEPAPLMARLLEAVEAGDRVGEEAALRALNVRARARRRVG